MDIYLDHNATTPVDPTVVDTVTRHLTDRFGNAASSHVRGRAAAAAVDAAREQVAGLLSVVPGRVVWTSGATEAINTALKGLAGVRGHRNRLVVSAIEHKAVLDVAEYLASTWGWSCASRRLPRPGRSTLMRSRRWSTTGRSPLP